MALIRSNALRLHRFIALGKNELVIADSTNLSLSNDSRTHLLVFAVNLNNFGVEVNIDVEAFLDILWRVITRWVSK